MNFSSTFRFVNLTFFVDDFFRAAKKYSNPFEEFPPNIIDSVCFFDTYSNLKIGITKISKFKKMTISKALQDIDTDLKSRKEKAGQMIVEFIKRNSDSFLLPDAFASIEDDDFFASALEHYIQKRRESIVNHQDKGSMINKERKNLIILFEKCRNNSLIEESLKKIFGLDYEAESENVTKLLKIEKEVLVLQLEYLKEFHALKLKYHEKFQPHLTRVYFLQFLFKNIFKSNCF